MLEALQRTSEEKVSTVLLNSLCGLPQKHKLFDFSKHLFFTHYVSDEVHF